ncbi:glycosyl hydrolase 115 family protein [Prevotella sp. P2-180]|uniref:glycosyl hydrolase 115 family protein n=1 Tax=Prevotella sp. P2-180 TaxID=2024224 RepID=UPI00209BF6F0|nr:glycosyl hydrolase 115 family protein [Prevotella sp. P2-180]
MDKKDIKMRGIFLVMLCIASMAQAAAKDDVFSWYDGGAHISYSLSKSVSPVVTTAIQMWGEDMMDVTGAKLKKEGNDAKVRIVQMDKDKAAEKSLKAAGIDVETLKRRKDAFCIKVTGNQLIVAGGNGRGTAYGILELSRMAGVSPWKWWADEMPEKRKRLEVPADFHTEQSPSVEYRGIFINDEDWSTQPWSWRTFSPARPGMISALAYKEVFKLLMRLRANAIWPAMHESSIPFFLIPGAKEVADSCGIVIGTSHCEPMMRNNAGEWNTKERGAYNYIKNKEGVQNYWTERLKEAGKYENIYTIGMRGIHDGAMEGVGKNLDDQTAALQQVIDDQRVMLGKCVSKRVEQIPQQFVPYKEVLKVMENGLVVPDDVMLTWCDDNYGYMTRLSDSLQQKRKGGAGVYYHLSYWGRPHDYLWLSTTQPGLIYNEMREAYDHNARRLWIANVHELKTAAYDLELFLDMAWNINSIQPSTIYDHQLRWLCREFGQQAGERLLPVMQEFYRLTAIRKPEFMGWTQVELDKKKYQWGWSDVSDTEFSLTAFGGELDRYLTDWRKVTDALEEIEKTLPENRHATFFSHVKYPVLSAAAMSRKMLEAQRARFIAKTKSGAGRWQRDEALLTACAKSQDAYQQIRNLTAYYNNELADGKWQHLIVDNPRDLYVFYAPKLPMMLTDEEVHKYKNQPDNTVGEIANDGSYIARNACQWDKADEGAKCVEALGHSMNAVRLPKGRTVTYTFDCPREGEAILRMALIPTQPNDKGELRFSVRIDGGEPQMFSLKEPFRSERWKLNVLRQQALRELPVNIAKGNHTLTIEALDNHIVLDQWMLDFDKSRKFYVFPIKPEY